MLLTSVEEFSNGLGIEDAPDIQDAIATAMLTTGEILSSKLDTDFNLATVTDTFYVQGEDLFTRGERFGAPRTEFRLSRGFVSPQSVILTNQSRMADYFHIVVRYSDNDPPNVGDLQIDPERGTILDVRNFYARSNVQITYVAGFPVSDADPESYDLDFVPKWLQRAASMQARLLIADSAVLKQADVVIDTASLESQLSQLLLRKRRYTPLAIYPL